ncbi:serine carboxypeptidase-like 18 isoform X3 [Medicago truncatula]|uniref:serine carboxypeptidase-like 18 isoform X3 n=1 Tax=Medicago truncatula TaxID=3880 RepID=UPI000D2F344D|nr:serine carboxypeptidase-like 18 isoform X3 [Medicago truncatula]
MAMLRLSSHQNQNGNILITRTLFKMIIIFVLAIFLLLQNSSTNLVFATSQFNIVKYLPGFQGPLPFVLETGYVGVGETETDENSAELFYYFLESENNPKQDPLLLWLTGGPGCSAFSGLAFEIGPITFKNEEYNGSLPNLILRPHSWTKVSNIIFLDLPVGTGFSYPKTEGAAQQSTWKLVHNAHQFLRKWLIDHPKFISNEVYIAGDSYSGLPIPIIVQEISYGNEGGLQPWINLQTISGVYEVHILESKCEFGLPNPLEANGRRRLLIHKANTIFTSSLTLPPLNCRSHAYFLGAYWANDANVQNALHIRKGSIGKWKRCNFDIPFKHEIDNSFEYHVNLSRKGYRSLIYSGDHDMKVPFVATQAWIRSLNYSIVDDWRQWYSNSQVAGYTRTYSNRMTFATVKGAGHTAPEYKREECLAMLSRWISNNPL